MPSICLVYGFRVAWGGFRGFRLQTLSQEGGFRLIMRIAVTRTIKLVSAPLFQLQNRDARVPDLLRLSSNSCESYAPTRDPIQTRADEGVRCPGVAGSVAGARDLAGLLPRLAGQTRMG